LIKETGSNKVSVIAHRLGACNWQIRLKK